MRFPDSLLRRFSPVAALALAVITAPAHAATQEVTNLNDSGAGSLRTAITVAKAGDTIAFDLTGTAPFVIQPLSPLPSLTVPIFIDGTTQPGYAGEPLIELNGAEAGTVNGLSITAADTTVSGLDIQGFGGNGLEISGGGASGDRVWACFIGTDPTGKIQAANGGAGILITSGAHSNTMGGTSPAVRNVISANGGGQIVVSGAGTNGNVIDGNFIGTDVTGKVAINPDNGTGILISTGPQDTRVGGTTAGESNLIAGNSTGVLIQGGGPTDTTTKFQTVEGNIIGPDVTGEAKIGNNFGVQVEGARDNLIGGPATSPGAFPGNLIAGNSNDDVELTGAGTIGNKIEGNLLGTDAKGAVALGSVGDLISIDTGASGNTVGGATANLGNLLSGGSNGVEINGTGSNGNLVQGNFIGTDISGTKAIANTNNGVLIDNGAQQNTVGGTAAVLGQAPGNLISGNSTCGVFMIASETFYNTVQGNLIGTDLTGKLNLGNGFAGVLMNQGSSFNQIGGTNSGEGNVILGSRAGVEIDIGSTGSKIQGNLIGTDITGALAILPAGNTAVGILITSGSNLNVIGGTAGGARNVIAGLGTGISIDNTGTNGTVVQGNYVGYNINKAPLGNSVCGIEITSGSNDTLVGGTAPGAGNLIGNNGNSGIRVSEPTTFGNTIRGNSIYNDGGLGINLESMNADAVTNHFVTANHLGFDSMGPNHLQNYPVLGPTVVSGGKTTITGTLNSLDNRQYAIDFYGNAIGDPSGFGEGQTYLGSVNVTTNATGNASFTFVATGTYSGPTVSSTATDLVTGDSSEFGPLSSSNIVTNTSDSGPGSLRQALTVVSYVPNATVAFNIPASYAAGGTYTVEPLTPLPSITMNGTVIDATTQDAFEGKTGDIAPEVVINGTNIPGSSGANGLNVNADSCLIRGLVVQDFNTGIDIFGTVGHLLANADQVTDCYVGTTAAGLASATASNNDGIRLGDDGYTPGTGATNGIIGGTTPGTANVLSNNDRYGVFVSAPASANNHIEGNFIGTDLTGTIPVPGLDRAVGLLDGAHNNTVGGPTAGARNVIFSDGSYAIVVVSDPGTQVNSVQGNFIGVNAGGTLPLVPVANAPDIFGVRIANGAANNLVTDNLIAGITNGIGITDPGSNANVAQGNLIGVGADGTTPIPNLGNGVIVAGGAQDNIVGAPDTASGPMVAADGNAIANSFGGDGVRIYGAVTDKTIGNTIRGNRIYNSEFLGISLLLSTGTVGVVPPNSPENAAPGPNDLQNYPLLTPGTNQVSGSLNSFPNRQFVIDLYQSAGNGSACATGTVLAEGETWLGSQTVTTNASGNAVFTFNATAPAGDVLTATATDLTTGDTSDFTPVAEGVGSSIVTSTADSGTGSLRDVLLSGGCGNSTISFNIPRSDPGFNPATGAYTITCLSPLPALSTSGLCIDGTTQPGYAGSPIIVINGSKITGGGAGLVLGAANCRLTGLVVDGFGGAQISITGAAAHGNVVQGCYVGTNATGTAGVAGGPGITITSGASNNVIGVIPGGTGRPNVIAFNGGDGITVGTGTSDLAIGNTLRGNSIFNNAGLGINLKGGVEDSHGVTANHAGSASGPNHLQNYPVLSALSLLPGQTLGALTVQLSGLPNTSYGIDLYRDTAPNASGYGEGQYYLGTQSVTTDGNGNYTGSMSFVLGQNSVGQYLSATATNLTTGDTSEFGLTQLLASALKSWSSSAATPSGQSSSPAASGGTS